MSGSVLAGMPSSPGVENPAADDVGLSKWQRARLVLDQYQRGVDAGPTGQVLPVRAELARLLPFGGLRRGSTVVVRGSTTVLLALLAEATADGAWAAVVGMPDLGLLAAAELGVAVTRLALVPKPGAELGAVVAALLDGIDLVVVASDTRPGLARRLSARARHRESVLLSPSAWPAADLELDCVASAWSGVTHGAGHLTSHELTVTTTGRGSATRMRHTRLAFPTLQPTPLHPTERTTEPSATSPTARPTARPAARPTAPATASPASTRETRFAEPWPTRLGGLPGPFGPQPPTPADLDGVDRIGDHIGDLFDSVELDVPVGAAG